MRRTLAVGMLTSALAVAAGCQSNRFVYYLNPDGSGKVEIDATLQSFDLGERTSRYRRLARKIVTGASGIDAWRDVEYSTTADSRVKFQGTAYFRDVSTVGFPELIGLRPKLERGGADGEVVLSIAIKKATRGDTEADEPGRAVMSDEELDRKVRSEQRRFRRDPESVAKGFDDLDFETVVHLPGEPREVFGFERHADGSLGVAVHGEEMAAAISRTYADEDRLRNSIRLSSSGGAAAVTAMFGEEAERIMSSRAVFDQTDVPLFDYETEMAEARAGMKKLLFELRYGKGFDGPLPGPGVFVWRDQGGVCRSGLTYPWRSVVPGGPAEVAFKVLVPVLGSAGYLLFTARAPAYLRYPYADEALGSAYLLPELNDFDGNTTAGLLFGERCAHATMVNDTGAVDAGGLSTRVAVTHLESGDESGSRAEYRLDLPGYFGFEGGAFDVDGRERTYFRFSNAFVMNTRAVASLDLGAAWLDSERDDARFEWGVSADLFPRKPWLVHMSWHSLDGSDRPSETRAAVGVALKALELTAGWTRDRGPLGEEHFLEIGARLWWAF